MSPATRASSRGRRTASRLLQESSTSGWQGSAPRNTAPKARGSEPQLLAQLLSPPGDEWELQLLRRALGDLHQVLRPRSTAERPGVIELGVGQVNRGFEHS